MSEHPKPENYDSDSDFLDAMADHYGIDRRMLRRIPCIPIQKMSTHEDDTCPHLVVLGRLEAENARLKADVNELADGLKLASEVGIKMADEVTRLKAEVKEARKISGEGMSVTLDLNNQLCAENARLNAEVSRLKSLCDCLGMGGKHTITAIEDENVRLKAEVERLTKYYIDPASILRLTEDGKHEKNGFGYITKFTIEVNKDAFERLSNVMMAYWHAAKEGKQP